MNVHLNRLRLKVASTSEELLQAFAIRTLVYIGEQSCPWAEEFDGNDFAATQILGLIDGEPAATARVRWFGTFAKLERLAIRTEHRGAGYGRQLLAYLLRLCRKKGFSKVYLHAQARLQSFYEEYGFCRIGEPFGFSDHAYVEMVAALAAAPDTLAIPRGPHVLNRQEGRWEFAGVLEKSAARMDPAALQAPSPSSLSLVPSYR